MSILIPIQSIDLAMSGAGLQELMADLDQMYWGGKISRHGWTIHFANIDEFGTADPAMRRIRIRQNLVADLPELRSTVLHELIHAHLFIAADPSHQRRNESHGTAFRAELARLIQAGELVHGEYEFCVEDDQERLHAATACFFARQQRRERPEGSFNNSRWYPSEKEWQSCCSTVRQPSRKWPFSFNTHCRTVSHVSRLYAVDTVALRREIGRQTRGEAAHPSEQGGDAPARLNHGKDDIRQGPASLRPEELHDGVTRCD